MVPGQVSFIAMQPRDCVAFCSKLRRLFSQKICPSNERAAAATHAGVDVQSQKKGKVRVGDGTVVCGAVEQPGDGGVGKLLCHGTGIRPLLSIKWIGAANFDRYALGCGDLGNAGKLTQRCALELRDPPTHANLHDLCALVGFDMRLPAGRNPHASDHGINIVLDGPLIEMQGGRAKVRACQALRESRLREVHRFKERVGHCGLGYHETGEAARGSMLGRLSI